MTLSWGFKTALVSLAAVATMALAASCGSAKKAEVPMPPQTSTIDTIVSPTTSVVTETPEEKATLETRNGYELMYKKGDVSWTTNVADDVEKTISDLTNKNLHKDIHDFAIETAVIDEKDRYAIVIGNITDAAYSKIAFLDLRTGKELSSYWLDRCKIADSKLIYDVDTGSGLVDYLVVVGELYKESFLLDAMNHTKEPTKELPFIEVRSLVNNGSVRESFNPLTYVDGTATGIKVLRSNDGKVSFDVDYWTRRYPSGTRSSVELNQLLKLEEYAPVFK